jgi:hypothetical protein
METLLNEVSRTMSSTSSSAACSPSFPLVGTVAAYQLDFSRMLRQTLESWAEYLQVYCLQCCEAMRANVGAQKRRCSPRESCTQPTCACRTCTNQGCEELPADCSIKNVLIVSSTGSIWHVRPSDVLVVFVSQVICSH